MCVAVQLDVDVTQQYGVVVSKRLHDFVVHFLGVLGEEIRGEIHKIQHDRDKLYYDKGE